MKLEWYLLPLDAYGNKFTYDNYGFPDVGINKALNKGQSKYYAKIDIDFGEFFGKIHYKITTRFCQSNNTP